MKKIFLILGLFLSLLFFSNSAVLAAPHGPNHGPHHAPMMHKPPHHAHMHYPPRHHHHHVRHSSFIYPSYFGYYNPYVNLHFPVGRIYHPMHHGHLGATFHISI